MQAAILLRIAFVFVCDVLLVVIIVAYIVGLVIERRVVVYFQKGMFRVAFRTPRVKNLRNNTHPPTLWSY